MWQRNQLPATSNQQPLLFHRLEELLETCDRGVELDHARACRFDDVGGRALDEARVLELFRERSSLVARLVQLFLQALALDLDVDEPLERDREICATIGPELRRRGLLFVGIDVIGDYLTEINVTSPTGARQLKTFGGADAAALLWDRIEALRT